MPPVLEDRPNRRAASVKLRHYRKFAGAFCASALGRWAKTAWIDSAGDNHDGLRREPLRQRWIAVAPDGRRFLLHKRTDERTSAEIDVVLN